MLLGQHIHAFCLLRRFFHHTVRVLQISLQRVMPRNAKLTQR